MIGLILAVVGAILLWGVNVTSTAVNINTIGAILLVVGIIEALCELVLWRWTWGRFFGDGPRGRY